MDKKAFGNRLWKFRIGLRYSGLGALILCLFSVVQKILIGEIELALRPQAYLVPILYGGTTGWLIGMWYHRLKSYSLRIEEEEERLRTLINALPDFVIFKDGQGRWQDVNDAGKRYFHFEDDTYRNMLDIELASHHSDLGDLFQWCYHTDEETWKEGRPFHCQVNGFAFENKVRWFDLVKVPIFHPGGERKGLLIVGRDVTDLKEGERKLLRAYDSTLDGWAQAVEMRDKSTEDHTRRVVVLAEQLAAFWNLSEEEMLNLRRGAMLHDIGKIGVPDSILNKPGPLTAEEMAIMQRHTQYAYEMLSKIDFLSDAVNIPYCHHERWDGTGYPRGLRGAEIPFAARIFSVVDVWDALTSDRPYRKAWTNEAAFDYIRQEAGKQFDPEIVKVFLDNLNVMKRSGAALEVVPVAA